MRASHIFPVQPSSLLVNIHLNMKVARSSFNHESYCQRQLDCSVVLTIFVCSTALLTVECLGRLLNIATCLMEFHSLVQWTSILFESRIFLWSSLIFLYWEPQDSLFASLRSLFNGIRYWFGSCYSCSIPISMQLFAVSLTLFFYSFCQEILKLSTKDLRRWFKCHFWQCLHQCLLSFANKC